MNSCQKYKKHIILHVHQALDKAERAELKAHLAICPSCRTKLEEMEKFKTAVGNTPMIDPDEETLKVMRNAVALNIQKHRHRHSQPAGLSWRFLRPAPIWQLGFTLLVLFLGFMLGQALQKPTEQPHLQPLITASEPIQTLNSTIDPQLAGINKIKYDPVTGMVEISYNTVNTIQLRTNMNNRNISTLLDQAMLEPNPAVRLNAVQTVGMVAQNKQTLVPEFLRTIETVLAKDDNQGIRLAALKILRILPLSPDIKDILIRILLYDHNTAMRIEAFKVLSEKYIKETDSMMLLKAAQQDTNGYIRYKAKELVEELDQTNYSKKIERKDES
jgi:hypothetical protein